MRAFGDDFFSFSLGRDVKMESGRQRHPSGGVSAKEMVIGLEGVELGADGKVRTTSGTFLSDTQRCVVHFDSV